MEASAETWTNTDIKNEAGLKRPGDVAEIREKLGHPDPKGRNLPWERQEILDFLKLSDQGMSEEAAIKEIVSHRSSATQHSGNGNGHHGLPPAEESKPQSGQLSQAINQGAANLGDVGRTLGRMGGAALTQNFVHEALSTGSQGIVEVTEQLKQRVEKELGQLIDVDAIPLEEGRINYLPRQALEHWQLEIEMNIVDRTSKSIVGTIILGTLAGGAFAVGWWFADSRLGNLSEKIAYGFISGGFVSAACVVGGAVGQQLELQRLLQLLNKPEVSESNKKMAKLIATEIASLMEPKDGQE